jgi:branched-chain amino acid transport system substrate-binding protein
MLTTQKNALCIVSRLCEDTPMKHRFAAALTLAALMLGIGAPAGAQPAPLEINVMLSMSGPVSFLGKAEQAAFDTLETMVNKKGGIAGHPIKFVVADDTSNPQVALQLANSYIAKGVPVFVGSPLASACFSFMAIIAKTGPVDYCLSPPVSAPAGSYVFTAGASAVDQATALMKYLKDRGLTKIAVLTTTDATGHDFENSYLTVLGRPENKTSMTLVGDEHFAPTDLSVAAQIARLKAANPQVIVMGTIGLASGTIFRGLQDSGLDLPVAAPNGNMLYSEMANFSTILPKELIFPAYRAMTEGDVRPGPIKDAQNAFFAALKTKDLKPDAASVTAWDPMNIILSAYQKFGVGMTAQQLHTYMLDLHSFAGVNGIYDFRDGSQRGIDSHSIVIDRWVPAKTGFVVVSRPGGAMIK